MCYKTLVPQFFVFLLCLTIFSGISFALESQFPRGCHNKGFRFDNRFLILEPVNKKEPQTIYLLHNLSHEPLTLELKKYPEQVYSPIYKNQINPNQWGAFSTDEKFLKFTCISGRGKKSEITDCSKILEICQYVRAKFPYGNMGSYWAISSDPLLKTKRSIIDQGILLRW